jgi:hypothetical protein
MDDSTHSVYLATPASTGRVILRRQAMVADVQVGGKPILLQLGANLQVGDRLGELPGACFNLDTHFAGKRIRCVYRREF